MKTSYAHKIHRAISWIFIPPLVYALLIVAAAFFSFEGVQDKIIWSLVTLGISFGAPSFYYIFLRMRYRLDSDVKDKKMREALFKVNILSLLAAFVALIYFTEAHILQKALIAVILVNILFTIVLVIFKIELSFHIAMVTLLAVFIAYYFPYRYALIGAVPVALTAWSRYTLRMHTLKELVFGCLASAGIYIGILVPH